MKNKQILSDIDGSLDIHLLIDKLNECLNNGYTSVSIKEKPHGYNTISTLIVEREKHGS
jgi:hypothetical protein